MAIYCINIIYKFFYETIASLSVEPFMVNWNQVYFIPEIFNLTNYRPTLSKDAIFLPIDGIHNGPFYYFRDNNDNIGYALLPKKRLI
jgi:hypothetical protein